MKSSDFLEEFRKQRGFITKDYVDKKVAIINQFFLDNKLDSAVLGISGGIDSAVVLYLLEEASRQIDSPIKKILALSLPIHKVIGVTGQAEATKNAIYTVDRIKRNSVIQHVGMDLGPTYGEVVKASMTVNKDVAWAEGQMASVLRTPFLYYHAAILQTQGYKSIVVGTTNRDEGAYIGFFGKASDAMVDLQPIADIHKSEVYKVAWYLGIPKIVLWEEPKGDVWDGKTDVEMIGATYDDIELYLLQLEAFGQPDSILMEEIPGFKNIEKLHQINKHKYQVGSPAHFIDVMPRKVPGGW